MTPHLQRLSLVPMAAPTTSKAKIPKCYISVSLPCTMAGETTFSLGSQKANFQVTKVLFSIYHLDKACSSFCFSIWKQDNPTSSGIRSSISPAGEISWTLSYLLFSTCPNPIIIISASSAFKTPSPVYLHEDGLPLFRVSPPFSGLPRWLSSKESACQCSSLSGHGFNPWIRKILWRRAWQLTPVFLPGESHGQRSLVVQGVAKS